MGEERSTEDRVRVACARALCSLADRLEPDPRPPFVQPERAAPPPPGDTAFRYDTEMPPTVPAGQRLDDYQRAHHPLAPPRGRVATALRRVARRLDGTVVVRRPFG